MKKILFLLMLMFHAVIIIGQTSTVYLYHSNSNNWEGNGISGTYRDLAIDSWRFTFQASDDIDNYYKISTSNNNVVNGNVWSANILIDETSSTTIFDYGDPGGGAGFFPILNGNYYSFIFQDVNTESNSNGYVLKTSNEPRTITDVSHTNSSAINDNDPVIVTITINDLST